MGKWNGIFTSQNYNGDYFFDFVVPFVYYILESPEFYPKKVIPTTPRTQTKPQTSASTTSKATTDEVPKPMPMKIEKTQSRKASAGIVVPSVLGVMACLGI